MEYRNLGRSGLRISEIGFGVGFLRDELKDGSVRVRAIKERARRLDISDATLRRVKKALRIGSHREGDEGWSWNLPGKASRRLE